MSASLRNISFFFFNDTATTEIYTLSLHDALPICLVGPRGRAVDVGDLEEQLLRDAADPLDHLRGVAAVLPAQALEHAVRIAERRVLLRIAVGLQLELPRGLVVAPDGGVESAEEPVQVRRGLELGVEDQGGVRVRHDVIVEILL